MAIKTLDHDVLHAIHTLTLRQIPASLSTIVACIYEIRARRDSQWLAWRTEKFQAYFDQSRVLNPERLKNSRFYNVLRHPEPDYVSDSLDKLQGVGMVCNPWTRDNVDYLARAEETYALTTAGQQELGLSERRPNRAA